MLYTGEQIAQMYSTEKVKLTANNIRKWANRGLKHIRGAHNVFLYKKDWVDNFLEEEAQRNVKNIKIKDFETKNKMINKIKRYDFSECKVY